MKGGGGVRVFPALFKKHCFLKFFIFLFFYFADPTLQLTGEEGTGKIVIPVKTIILILKSCLRGFK